MIEEKTDKLKYKTVKTENELWQAVQKDKNELLKYWENLKHKINAFGFDTFGAVVERKN